jgi:hypothetical protein
MNAAASNIPPNSTPILDRIIPLPAPTKHFDPQRAIAFLLGGAIGLFVMLLIFGDSIGGFISSELSRVSFWPRSIGQFILLGCDFFIGFALATTVHETAHAVVGVWVGFDLHSLRIGPLQVDRPFRVSLFRGTSTVAAGCAGMIPVKTDAMALRLAAMVLAGPAANLLTGVTILLLPFSKSALSNMFVLCALFMGFLNLLPLQKGPELTDGMRILRLLRCRAVAERFAVLAKLNAEIKDGVPPEDLPPDLIAKAIAIKDNSQETVIAFSAAAASASSREDNVKAADHLETALMYSAYATLPLQQALIGDAARFQAKQKRMDLAEQWLAVLPKKTEIPWLRASVEASIDEAKGDIKGALTKLDGMERAILALPDQERRQLAHRSLLRWRTELLKPVGEPVGRH